MLSDRVMVIDTDARHWLNLIGLFSDNKEPPSVLLCLMEDNHCIKAIHTIKGVLWGFAFPGENKLDQALELAGADYALLLPQRALAQMFYEAQSAVDLHDNYVKQLMDLIAGVKNVLDEQAVWYPEKPYRFEPPAYEKIEKTFNRIWPDDSTIGFFVFENTRPFTSLIVGKEGGKISLITSLDALGMADQALDFRNGYQTYGEMIAQRFAPLHTALFIELGCFHELRAGAKPLSYLYLAEQRGRARLWPKPFKLRFALWAARKFKGL